jgi:hypothetical protein
MDKAEERYFLEAFLKLQPALQVEGIRNEEAPDFLATAGGEPVGIELVQFVFPHGRGISPQALDNYRSQFSRRLRERHAARGLAPVTVGLHLAHHEILMAAAKREELTETLLDFVAARVPPEGPHVRYDFDDLPIELYEQGVSSISILRHRALTKPFWSVSQSGFVPDSTGSLVQSVVDRKNQNCAAYRTKAPHLWLVIISGSKGMHSILDFDGDVLSTEYLTSFDRIFLFRTFGGSVHELKLRRSHPAPL